MSASRSIRLLNHWTRTTLAALFKVSTKQMLQVYRLSMQVSRLSMQAEKTKRRKKDSKGQFLLYNRRQRNSKTSAAWQILISTNLGMRSTVLRIALITVSMTLNAR